MSNNIEAIYKLTPMQQGMLFHTLYAPESADAYFEWLDFPLQVNLNVKAFKLAWQHVLDRHASLRAAFIWRRQGEPLQIIRAKVSLPWAQLDWSGLSPQEQQDELKALLRSEQEQGFELAKAPLMRLTLIQLDERSSRFVWCNHHLLFDGWSRVLILNEVFALYSSYARGESPQLSHALPYRDYIGWLQRQDISAAESFWRKSLAGFTEPTPLPMNSVPKELPEGQEAYGKVRIHLSVETTTALEAMARTQQLTLNTVMQGTWGLLLARYSGQQDVLFGAVVSGRPAELIGVEAMVGLFINTLPVRVVVSDGEEAAGWLRGLQEQQAEARQYEYSPLVQVQGWSDVPRGVALFESLLVFENYPIDASLRDGEKDAEAESSLFVEKSNYPLTVLTIPGRQLMLQFSFDKRRFDEALMVRMLGHLRNMVEGIAANPCVPLADIPLLASEERKQLLEEWNSTAREYPRDLCLHELFDLQVECIPDHLAVTYAGEQLTYRQLQRRANQLAHHLRGLGIGPDAPVGLLLDRSVEMVVAMLGVEKAGGAYVPLDAQYPRERLRYMVEDTGLGLVITTGEHSRLVDIQAAAVRLDAEREEIEKQSEASPENNCGAENLAYIMYTSGSTGAPKGIGVSHRAVTRLVCNTDYVQLDKTDRVAQAANPSFDATTFEVWGALLNGAQLVGLRRDLTLMPEECARELERRGVTAMFLTTALFNELGQGEAGCFRGLRHLLFGGEAVDVRRVREVMAGGEGPERLLHVYGPTEATTFATWYEVREVSAGAQTVAIGRPIANTTAYVLDERMGLVPVGVSGELYLGGDGLARGYVNRPELTAERFLPNPYSEGGGERLYRTGDVVRYLASGAIEFQGRRDQQVKVRGYRIELAEVEAALLRHAGVREAVVVISEREGEKRLVGYVGGEVSSGELRRHLKESVPEYMIPSALVVLEELPLTANGKVDRQGLPTPDQSRPEMEEAYAAPRNTVEESLGDIWGEVLRVERVGIQDNFFALGGDSILAIQIIARANQRGLRLTPKLLFQHQTIAQLATVATCSTAAAQTEQGVVSGALPLTAIQRWFFAQRYANPHHFNQGVLLEARRALEAAALGEAVGRVVRHHDALRLRFTGAGGEWRQTIVPAEEHEVFSVVRLEDLGAGAGEQAAGFTCEAQRLQRSLHLTGGPLLRVVLFEAGTGQRQRLLIIVHHLAMDGVSWRLLLEDLERAYEQAAAGETVRLPAKTTSFKQWAERIAEYARSAEVRGEMAYWSRQVRRPAALPVDFTGGRNTEGAARVVTRWLSAEMTRAVLTEVPATYHTQINDVLMTALVRGLSRWTGERGVLLEVEGHGREELCEGVDVTRTVGWFTSMYPVWLGLGESGGGIGEELKRVKEQLRAVPGKGIGYGLLRYMSGDAEVERLLSGGEEAEVSFNYLGQFDQVLGEEGLWQARTGEVGSVRGEGEQRTRLIDINGSVAGGRLQMSWTYGSEMHERETIERLGEWFVEELDEIVRHCREEGAGGHTPSDFPLAKLDKQKLDRVAMLIEEADETEAAVVD